MNTNQEFRGKYYVEDSQNTTKTISFERQESKEKQGFHNKKQDIKEKIDNSRNWICYTILLILIT